MSAADAFVTRCDEVAAKMGVSRSRLSTQLLGSGLRIRQIAEGGDIGVRRMEKALTRLKELDPASKQSTLEDVDTSDSHLEFDLAGLPHEAAVSPQGGAEGP